MNVTIALKNLRRDSRDMYRRDQFLVWQDLLKALELCRLPFILSSLIYMVDLEHKQFIPTDGLKDDESRQDFIASLARTCRVMHRTSS